MVQIFFLLHGINFSVLEIETWWKNLWIFLIRKKKKKETIPNHCFALDWFLWGWRIIRVLVLFYLKRRPNNRAYWN